VAKLSRRSLASFRPGTTRHRPGTSSRVAGRAPSAVARATGPIAPELSSRASIVGTFRQSRWCSARGPSVTDCKAAVRFTSPRVDRRGQVARRWGRAGRGRPGLRRAYRAAHENVLVQLAGILAVRIGEPGRAGTRALREVVAEAAFAATVRGSAREIRAPREAGATRTARGCLGVVNGGPGASGETRVAGAGRAAPANSD